MAGFAFPHIERHIEGLSTRKNSRGEIVQFRVAFQRSVATAEEIRLGRRIPMRPKIGASFHLQKTRL